MEELENKLLQHLIRAEEESEKLLRYSSSVFINMLNKDGAVKTVKKLIKNNPSKALKKLHEINRLDLTVEGVLINNPELHPLFTEAEIKKAKNRISYYNKKRASTT
jgi:16S rRNA U516 pseudouridylate synthase RsuA-like enzyme